MYPIESGFMAKALPRQSNIEEKWEFPREKLTLQRVLGTGAFTTVMQGIAKGIKGTSHSHTTTVAVKTIRGILYVW